MSKKKKSFAIPANLQEGISQTLNSAQNNIGKLSYEIIPLSKIEFDKDNPRSLVVTKADLFVELNVNDPQYQTKKNELMTLKSLAESIKRGGVRNPIEVYKTGSEYKLISGERRVLGSWLAGKLDIQARVLEHKPDELELRWLQWIENIEREDLSLHDRINNIALMADAYRNEKKQALDSEYLAELLGCSRRQAVKYMTVLEAPEDVQTAIMGGIIADLAKAALIANVSDTVKRAELIEACKQGISRESLGQRIKIREQKKLIVAGSGKNTKGRPNRKLIATTEKPYVIRQLFNYILMQPKYKEHRPMFSEVDWSNNREINLSLIRLFTLMADVEEVQ